MSWYQLICHRYHRLGMKSRNCHRRSTENSWNRNYTVWIRRLLTKLKNDDIHFENSFTTIYADNQKAIKSATNLVFQKRSKHIAVRYHYPRDLINQKIVDLIYHFTVEMIADNLTKSLKLMKFSNFIIRLRLLVKQDWFRSSEDVDNSLWESRYNTWHEVAIKESFDKQTLSKLFSIYKSISSIFLIIQISFMISFTLSNFTIISSWKEIDSEDYKRLKQEVNKC